MIAAGSMEGAAGLEAQKRRRTCDGAQPVSTTSDLGHAQDEGKLTAGGCLAHGTQDVLHARAPAGHDPEQALSDALALHSSAQKERDAALAAWNAAVSARNAAVHEKNAALQECAGLAQQLQTTQQQLQATQEQLQATQQQLHDAGQQLQAAQAQLQSAQPAAGAPAPQAPLTDERAVRVAGRASALMSRLLACEALPAGERVSLCADVSVMLDVLLGHE